MNLSRRSEFDLINGSARYETTLSAKTLSIFMAKNVCNALKSRANSMFFSNKLRNNLRRVPEKTCGCLQYGANAESRI
ncbi:hypothetical protein BOTNAR_0576g00040 [Botryotinia narcissicola]|uniref:Uncharacterized protein n=1 Tax=Botryotinia narcissicola TaxID=278944 RepID=A0A4Z1HBR0_9HELO|nr:hypothetical protein BOTNAR_0576g00040 [Botryotinia narcissicola]